MVLPRHKPSSSSSAFMAEETSQPAPGWASWDVSALKPLGGSGERSCLHLLLPTSTCQVCFLGLHTWVKRIKTLGANPREALKCSARLGAPPAPLMSLMNISWVSGSWHPGTGLKLSLTRIMGEGTLDEILYNDCFRDQQHFAGKESNTETLVLIQCWSPEYLR